MLANLAGKRGIITGLANENSIAFGCAQIFHQQGAELIGSYGHPKAGPFVEPLAAEMGDAPQVFCDVQNDEQLEQLFAMAEKRWGGLDFVLHSIAFAPMEDLRGRVVDSSRQGFLQAMDISCHSFMRMARLAEPLMKDGGTLLTVSYQGANKVIGNYNLMGPVKAALEASVRYMAAELGPKDIRVHALSPGPMPTRAASGIEDFDELLERAEAMAPERRLVTLHDVGNLAAFLVSDQAAAMTGNIAYIDGGHHIVG